MRALPLALWVAREEDVAAVAELSRSEPGPAWTGPQLEAERGRGGLLVLSGPAGLAAYCCVRFVADEVQVDSLAVASELRRRGLGKRLLSLLLGLARSRRMAVALLEVRAGNRAAQGLYRSLGFEPCGVRRDYYSQPVEDAVLLRLHL